MNEPGSMQTRPSTWRNPVMWLVVGLPLLSIVAGVGLLVVATRTGGADAVNDPVRRVAQIQTTDLGADERAGALGLRMLVRERDGRIEALPVSGHFPQGQTLRLLAEHPTDRARDRTLMLAPQGACWLSKDKFEDARVHDWKFSLTPGNESWRLRARMPKAQRAVVLEPAVPAAE